MDAAIALASVAGYTVGNDVSVRDGQQDTPTMGRARPLTRMARLGCGSLVGQVGGEEFFDPVPGVFG